jgi:hypothetical protein
MGEVGFSFRKGHTQGVKFRFHLILKVDAFGSEISILNHASQSPQGSTSILII